VANVKDLYDNKKQLEIYVKIHHLAIKDEEDKQRFFDIFSNICDSISIEGISHIFPDFDVDGQRTDVLRYGECEVKRRQICAICFKTLNINADGSCSPCSVDWAHKVIIGNILKNSLFDIWNGHPLRKLQMRFCSHAIGKGEACLDCSDYFMSGHEDIDDYADEILKRLHVKEQEPLC
jgi:radical SAM protein with 4Fe4S-binding SPASM domain